MADSSKRRTITAPPEVWDKIEEARLADGFSSTSAFLAQQGLQRWREIMQQAEALRLAKASKDHQQGV